MNIQTNPAHPTFSRWFQRFFGSGFVIAAALFAGGYFARKHGFAILGMALLISFGISLLATLGGLFYRLFNVKCPQCGGKTRTVKDPSQTCWVAHCKGCDITWNLGVGAAE